MNAAASDRHVAEEAEDQHHHQGCKDGECQPRVAREKQADQAEPATQCPHGWLLPPLRLTPSCRRSPAKGRPRTSWGPRPASPSVIVRPSLPPKARTTPAFRLRTTVRRTPG